MFIEFQVLGGRRVFYISSVFLCEANVEFLEIL